MSVDSAMEERIVTIEIRIDPTGISEEELDSSTRQPESFGRSRIGR